MLLVPWCLEKATFSTETATRLVCTGFSYKACMETAPVRFIFPEYYLVKKFFTPCALLRRRRTLMFQEAEEHVTVNIEFLAS